MSCSEVADSGRLNPRAVGWLLSSTFCCWVTSILSKADSSVMNGVGATAAVSPEERSGTVDVGVTLLLPSRSLLQSPTSIQGNAATAQVHWGDNVDDENDTYFSCLNLDLMMCSDSATERWIGAEVPGLTSGWFSLNLAYSSMSSFLELRLLNYSHFPSMDHIDGNVCLPMPRLRCW